MKLEEVIKWHETEKKSWESDDGYSEARNHAMMIDAIRDAQTEIESLREEIRILKQKGG